MNIELFDFSVNILEVILWQYSQSPNLISLLTKKNSWYSQNVTQFWNDWYNNVFNLETANEFGLAVWSFILNVPLFISLNPEPSDAPIWGFNSGTYPTYDNSYVNFNNGNFRQSQTAIQLTLEEQRWVLKLRYYQLFSSGDVFDINTFLAYLSARSAIVPNGSMWALDGLDMTMTYVFDFEISQNLRQVLTQYDLLPRPAGVMLKYVIGTQPIFGFGLNYKNFGNGNFYANPFP